MKKAVLYTSSQNGYAGGGLNYLLGAAAALKEVGYEVTCKIPTSIDTQKIKENYDVGDIKMEVIPYGGQSLLQQLKIAVKELLVYDVIIYHANQPPRMNFIRKSFILCDFPIHKKKLGFKDKIRLFFWKKVLVNSQYTRAWINEFWHENAEVLYPPIPGMPVSDKNPFQLISVGRFHGGRRSKRQDLIIDAFINLADKSPLDWQLHLAGFDQDKNYLNLLYKKARGYNVKFHENISFTEKQRLLSNCGIYIHACGFGIDETLHPGLAEHFGISVAESMAAGCVPFVIPKGGPREIVEDGKDGFYWEDPKALLEKIEMISGDREKFQKMVNNSVAKSRLFSQETFKNKLKEIIADSI